MDGQMTVPRATNSGHVINQQTDQGNKTESTTVSPATASVRFAELLDLLNVASDERISICSAKPGGKFEATVPRNRVDSIKLAASTPYVDTRDVWYGVNPVDTPTDYRGRGTDQHVTRCASLFADLDIKDGGIIDSTIAEAITHELASALGTTPVAVVSTGNGWHLYFSLDPDDDAWRLDTDLKRAAAQALYRRFHRLCAHIADQYGCCVDNVGQLSRVLRVPGTFNRKNPDSPLEVVLFTEHPYGGGGPLTFAEVAERLDEFGVPEMTEDAETPGVLVSDPDGWQFAAETRPYVASMVAGWRTDRPTGSRHSWLVSQATRLACTHKLGRITAGDHAKAVQQLTEVFEVLLSNGDKRKPTPGEISGALAWGQTKTSTFTEERAAEEVGGTDADVGTSGDDNNATPHCYYPPEFWNSRESLQHLRDAALSRRAAPDAVLVAVMARLAAHLPPGVNVETGIMSPVPMNMFAAPTSRTGRGKTSVLKASIKVVEFDLTWSMDPHDKDDIPVRTVIGEAFPREGKIRTGEGVAEMYYGVVDSISPVTNKPIKVRKIVRTNALMITDEGAGLIKLITDPKMTVGETIREAFSRQGIGQSNADETKYRYVPGDAYSLGIVAGFQLSVLVGMLTAEELNNGTPQRFLYAWCKPDPSTVTPAMLASLTDPGPLRVAVPHTGLRLCPTLQAKVNAEHLSGWLGDDKDDDTPVLESQRLAMVARTAGHLAIIDGRTETDANGLLEVNEQDWELAEMMFERSCVIASLAISEHRKQRAQAKKNDRARDLAADIEDEESRSTPVGRAKARIVGYLAGAGCVRWTGKGGVRDRNFNGGALAYADAALTELVSADRVRLTESGRSKHVEMV